MINHRLNNAFFPLFLFLSKSATINFKTPNIFYVFRCNTTAINNIYKVYCEPHHGMGMLKVPEEATKECFGEIDIQTGAEVKIMQKTVLIMNYKLFTLKIRLIR